MNHHDTNPHYRPAPLPPGWSVNFQWAILESYHALNARAEARFVEECIQFSRPLDKPLDVREVH